MLDPPADLWWQVFGEKAPASASKAIPREGLPDVLGRALRDQWAELHWSETPLSAVETQALERSISDSPICMLSTT